MERIRFIGSVGAATLMALAITLFLPGVPSADTEANSGQVLLISDEINGNSVDVDRASAAGGGNNGHGNNTDGVDSSNPGQGGGGPNGGYDASCDGSGGCVDDEGGGGGAAPSKP